MEISFDPAKRNNVLRERGLDFLDAGAVLDGRSITSIDDRLDYGETRYVTYGWLAAAHASVGGRICRTGLIRMTHRS